ncbi:MAG: glutamate racemase [Desulfobacteraceae bacterium]|nr:glutamate racemase [Desulfobacteraceae bacterium]
MKTAANDNPLGVFDSGVGGVSVLRWIRRQLPREDLIYVSDAGYAPYGNRSPHYVEERAVYLTRFLLEHRVKAVVVACNTATVTSIARLRSLFPVPFIGIEPGVKPALAATANGIVGVLATTETLKSSSFHNLIHRFCKGARVEVQGCPGLMEQVEAMAFTTPKTRALLDRYLTPLLEKGADTIVLGCTHYPFLAPLIREMAGEGIRIIDTGEAVSRQVCRALSARGLLTSREGPGAAAFWTSGSPTVETVLSSLWGESVTVGRMP